MTTTTDLATSVQASTTATTTTTAQQPLNIYKKIAVIRYSSDVLTYDDNDGNTKIVSVQELGDAITSTTAAATSSATTNTFPTNNNTNTDTSNTANTVVGTTKTVNTNKLDIPVPKIVNVIEYNNDVSDTYQQEISYVRYHRQTPKIWNTTIEYIADLEDELWLNNNIDFGTAANIVSSTNENTNYISTDDDYYNDYPYDNRTNSNQQQQQRRRILPLRIFEHMMDIFEKATAFESIITEIEAEQLLLNKLPKIFMLFPSIESLSFVNTSNSNFKVITGQIVIKQVYTYWVNKRSKLKRPLLRKYWPVTSVDDTNPHLVFRPRNEKEKYKLRVRKTRTVAAQAAAAAAAAAAGTSTGGIDDTTGIGSAAGGANTTTGNAAATTTTTTVADIVLANTVKRLRLLKDDMLNYTSTLNIVVQREEIYQLHVHATIELFNQRFYNITDTSGLRRKISNKNLFKRKNVVNNILLSGISTSYEPLVVSNNTTTGRRTIRRIEPYPTMFTPIPLINTTIPIPLSDPSTSTSTTTKATTTTPPPHFVQQYLKKVKRKYPDESDTTNADAKKKSKSDAITTTTTSTTSSGENIAQQQQQQMVQSNNNNNNNNSNNDINYSEFIPNIAGKNFGEPAPNFLHPLQSREYYTTSYEGNRYDSEPSRPTYENGILLHSNTNSASQETNNSSGIRFRHRPRIGRGGRVIIDRQIQKLSIPSIVVQGNDSSTTTNATNTTHTKMIQPVIYRAGLPLPNYVKPKAHLLDLLPRPLHRETISRSIEENCIAAIHEEYTTNQNLIRHHHHYHHNQIQQQQQQQQQYQNQHNQQQRHMEQLQLQKKNGGNDITVVDEVFVPLQEYLDTDDQPWGTEHYSIGPI